MGAKQHGVPIIPRTPILSRFFRARLTDGLLAFASAALIWAAFPPLDCGFFAWVALVPLLLMAGRSASRRAWPGRSWRATRCSSRCSIGSGYVAPEGWLTLALYCALYWPAAALLLRWLKRRGLPFALTAPVTFAAFEFMRGNFFTGFPFFFLAHTQYRYLPIIQIADITGVYGITFLIALVNGCLADLILCECGVAECGARSARCRRRWVLVSCAVAVALVALTLGYGWSRMRALRPEPGPKVALVQGNVPQDLKDTPSYRGRDQDPAAPRRALQGGDRQAGGAGDLAGDDLSGADELAYDEEFVARLAARPDEGGPRVRRAS